MSEIITYGLIAIVLLVLGFAIIMGLAKAKRAGKVASKPESGREAPSTPERMSREQAAGAENSLPDIKIRGVVKNGAKKKVGRIINEHPEETMNLFRHWLHGNKDQDTD